MSNTTVWFPSPFLSVSKKQKWNIDGNELSLFITVKLLADIWCWWKGKGSVCMHHQQHVHVRLCKTIKVTKLDHSRTDLQTSNGHVCSVMSQYLTLFLFITSQVTVPPPSYIKISMIHMHHFHRGSKCSKHMAAQRHLHIQTGKLQLQNPKMLGRCKMQQFSNLMNPYFIHNRTSNI